MLQRFFAKLRLWADALEGIDDPLGHQLLTMENRVRRLESEVEGLRNRLSLDMDNAVRPAQGTD